jgi:hypothetical protein
VFNHDDNTYSGAWRELAETINQNKSDSYFNDSLEEMRAFYDKIGRPNGSREEDFWEWVKEGLFSARKRSLNKKEEVIRALEESLKRKL